ncbi:IS3 family transposase [Paenibacillus sp. MER TA 81-3]|uniref:IS3 family transposase n=1 Tax=Paenibacillus sp. MER TA 81-3 TaxID=2939573 RepID=UPI00203BD3FE|nr:IS3 family transposase [Paenibacillus sp. MER TA 81-3]MCM3341081.1 IS3 family transposase [Paenibacillus sp. MER TA 81-3]
MCNVLGVSRSGYYKWKSAVPSAQELRKAEVLKRITFHFQDSYKRYGSPKITHKLHMEGYAITERTVGSYMKELSLRSCISRKFKVTTTDSNHDLPIAPNILNQAFADRTPP